VRPNLFCIAAFTLAVVIVLPSTAADDVTLRDAAIGWLKANSTPKVIDDGIVKSLSKPIAEIAESGHNFTFLLGSEMTRTGKPAMVCGWNAELFPFYLTEGQAKALGMKPTELSIHNNRRAIKPAVKPAVFLSEFKVVDAASLDGGKPIKASVNVLSFHPFIGETMRYRLEVKFPGELTRTMLFAPKAPPKISVNGETVEMTFDPINPPGGKEKPYHGPVAVFLSVAGVKVLEPTKPLVYSNTVSALIDVE
jgi:hypothetical protein